MLKEEKTAGQLAAEYEVHKNLLYSWRNQLLVGLPNLFLDEAAQRQEEKKSEWQKEREALYAENGRLTTRVTWLEENLTTCLSKEERRQLIEALHLLLELATLQICKSAQGSQFTRPRHILLLFSDSISSNMDCKGRALDYIFTECLWRKAKEEQIDLQGESRPVQANIFLRWRTANV